MSATLLAQRVASMPRCAVASGAPALGELGQGVDVLGRSRGKAGAVADLVEHGATRAVAVLLDVLLDDLVGGLVDVRGTLGEQPRQ